MATSNLVIAGNTWTGVPALDVAKSGGGTTRFTNVSDTTATASDVKQGTYFYTSLGIRTEGTAGANPTFTIDGVTYEFDSETTYWYDWVYSNYAPSGSGIEVSPDDMPYVHIGGTPINYGISGEYPGDEIVANASYTSVAIYQQTDLTNTTWYFDGFGDIDIPFVTNYWDINFTSNGGSYTRLSVDNVEINYSNPMVTNTVFGTTATHPDWYNNAYRTIHITGGSDVTSISLYSLLNENATQTA